MSRSSITLSCLDKIVPLTDLDSVIITLGEILGSRYKLSFCSFSIWDTDRSLFFERLGFPQDAAPVHLRIDELDDYGFGFTIRSGEPWLISDVLREAIRGGEWPAREQYGTRSYAILPLRVRGQVAGALSLGSPVIAHFDESDLVSLRPVAQLMGMKAAALGVSPPPYLEPIANVLSGSVLLGGADPALCERVARLLPSVISTERFIGNLIPIKKSRPHILTVYCTTDLNEREVDRIWRSLLQHSRPLVVVCRRATARATARLVRRATALGLLGVDSEAMDAFDFQLRLIRWCFHQAARPDWKELGLHTDIDQGPISRVISVVERAPLHNWRVGELALEAGMSVERLNAVLRRATKQNTKQFLMALRFQLLDRFRKSGELNGEQLADLFGFPSSKKMYEWSHNYSQRVQ